MIASEWVKDALLEIGVTAAQQSVSGEKLQTGIRYGNRLMSSYDHLGLGYTTISSASDEVTIPPYSEEWAVYALAVRLATQFGPNENIIELKDKERTAYKQMLKNMDFDISANYPSILPVGNGNDCERYGRTFFPEQDSNILTEQGSYILTEEQ